MVKGALLDQDGDMHLIFLGGDGSDANVYYSRAPAAMADRAPAWAEPVMIGEGAIKDTAALAGDDLGNMFVLYGGAREGVGLYAVHSTDGGDTWSAPTVVALTHDPELFVWGIRFSAGLYVDQDQQLHTVWAHNNQSGQGREIYYARLGADHKSWSAPLLLASTNEDKLGQVTEPSIIGYGGELIVFYSEWPGSSPKRVMRRSFDGGRTWTDAVAPFASLGQYGETDFVIDNDGVLHLVLGDRIRGLNLWHSVWIGDRWQEPQPIAPSSEADRFVEGPLTFHPWWPELVVSQGNVLLVTWETDPGAAHNGTWSAYKVLDVSELPLVPLPTPAISPTIAPTPSPTPPVPTPTPSNRPSSIEQIDRAANEVEDAPARPLIVGIVPVILLISGIVLVRRMGYHRGGK
jgi:hypothetical protein